METQSGEVSSLAVSLDSAVESCRKLLKEVFGGEYRDQPPWNQTESGKAWSKVSVAGTGMCVHIPFRLNPIASLAWLGKQLPCPRV